MDHCKGAQSSLLSFPLRLEKLQSLHKQLVRCSFQFCMQQGHTV